MKPLCEGFEFEWTTYSVLVYEPLNKFECLGKKKTNASGIQYFFYDLFSKNKKKKKEKKRKKTKVNVIKRQTDNFRKEKKRIHANQMLFRNEELNCRIF